MTDEPASITLPPGDEMLKRLGAADPWPYLTEHFYPRLLPHAGETLNSNGVATALLLAITECAGQTSQPGVMRMRLYAHLPDYVRALVQDPALQAETLQCLRQAGAKL